MAIILSDFLSFPFNGGKGIRTNQLDGLIGTDQVEAALRDGLKISAYSSTATYSRGSANSIVTHSSGLFIYISGTERSSGHDPDTHPGYWLRLSEGVTYEVISSGSHRISARTFVIDGATDQVYLCTTTQTTPRDLTYIKNQAASIGGTFIELTAKIPTTWKGPHIIGQDYRAGDRVTTNANTRVYTARVDTDETPPHDDWIQTGPVGSGSGSFTLRQGATAPGNSLGDNDDWYLRTSNGQWYQKVSESWESRYIDQIGQAGSGLTAVSTTVRLSGDGTTSDPLDIADDGIVTGKIADDAVTGDKIADNTIHGGALINGTIATGKIGDAQVTGAKLSSSAVSTGKVADNAITQAKIAAGAVGSSKIASFSVIPSKLNSNAVTSDKIASGAVTSAKLAANAAGEGKVPIDNTLQFDGSGDLGVNIERTVQEVSEWVQHFATGDSHDTSGHSGKYQEYTSPNTHRRIGSVQYDFDPLNDSAGGGTGKTYQVFIVELTGRNVDVILGSSQVYSGNSHQHRFHFTDGVMINPNVRIGIGLHRTDGGNNEGLSVRFGNESQDSPRESYDDASEDFKFVGRFNHDRPTPSVNDTVGGATANQIYGNPEIFYQIIHTHESLVGDGTVSASHISSGSAAADTALLADGAGAAAFRSVPERISWGFQIDTKIVPELNQDAITDPRIVLEDSGLTHYLDFLDWTQTSLDGISHLPVGAYIGLRQGSTIRILRVEAVWDATNSRYQVINVNAGGILEASTGTDTELLLTAGSGAAVADNRLIPGGGTDGQVLTKVSGTDYDATWESPAAGGGGGSDDFTRTLIGTSSSMGTTVVTLNLSEAIADGELLEILWRASAGGRIYGSSLISADAILDLTAQTTTPTTNSTGIQFKIGDTATGLNIYGHGSGFVWLIDTDSIYVANGRQRAMVAEVYKLVPPAGSQSGEESPTPEGVAALTPDLVTVTLYKWVLNTAGKPANPTAHWRFGDEWDGTTPFDGGGWYVSRADALDAADNNPDFSQNTWTLWIATEQVRRRVVSEAYSYTDGGYSVTAAWDIQYSADGTTWVSVEPTDIYNYIRYRDQETGEFGPTIPVGTNVGNNDWQPIRTNDLVYPGGSNQDELGAVYDFGNFAELLFIVAGYRSITVPDGQGGTMIIGVNGPWHSFILNRGGGWPTADASENEDNNDADDGSCFQFTYFATNTGVGLLIWERGDEQSGVNPGNPPFLQSNSQPPIQLGGHFKIVSTDGDEAHVTKFRFFAFSDSFARTSMSIFARYR